ncbi:SSI family serine proteinase inhibitor [Streptosporangium sp. NPDC000509]|uniref:SSI family serine proteinase inhibitor n=1 Tax=Streptosporangium sp. NPDC000509 TaxID=3366186 RepID=UPI003683F53E
MTRPLPLHPGEPAQIMPAPVRPFPGERPSRSSRVLVLSLARGEKPLPALGHALLLCDQPGGTHPDAVHACALLANVLGDPGKLRPRPGVACTLEYDPVTVAATGIWNGRFIRFERTYGSLCSMRAATGPLFAFTDNLGRSVGA